MSRLDRRLVGLLIVTTAVGGASWAHAAVGELADPARVGVRADRVDPPPAADLTPEQRAAFAMVELVNAERARHGLPAMAWDDRAGAAAHAHAADMAANRVMQHAGTDGSDAGDRLHRFGFDWVKWAENIGAGFHDADSLFAAWMDSSGHRQNILGDFRVIGVGAVAASDGAPYWSLVVAS